MAYCKKHTSYWEVSSSLNLNRWLPLAAFQRFSELLQRAAIYLVVATVFLSGPIQPQVSPEDHHAHHPDVAAPLQQPTLPYQFVGKSTGMMEGMGEMMRQMGVPPPKDIYPSLMTLSDLPPEKRADVV